jgi:hypothetical protein
MHGKILRMVRRTKPGHYNPPLKEKTDHIEEFLLENEMATRSQYRIKTCSYVLWT